MIRLIARIDVRNGYHIKTVNCEGVLKLRTIDDSINLFSRGNNEHDEIVLMDSVASLYGYSNWLIRQSDQHFYCPIPLSIGGAIGSAEVAIATLEKGADKLVINTAAVEKPDFLGQIAKLCGRQAVVLQVDTKKIDGTYKCFTHGARELSKIYTEEWIRAAQDNGVGELHVTSIDSEGTNNPFPDDLAGLIKSSTSLPVIISGGITRSEQMARFCQDFDIDSFSISSLTNRLDVELNKIRQQLSDLGKKVRWP